MMLRVPRTMVRHLRTQKRTSNHRLLSTQRPKGGDVKEPFVPQPPVNVGSGKSPAKVANPSPPNNGVNVSTKPSPPTSPASNTSSSGGLGAGTVVVFTALSTPAVAAFYLKQNPQWNPDAWKNNGTWIRFRELVLGESAKIKPPVTTPPASSTKQQTVKPKTTPKPSSPTADELSAIISKTEPLSVGSKAESNKPHVEESLTKENKTATKGTKGKQVVQKQKENSETKEKVVVLVAPKPKEVVETKSIEAPTAPVVQGAALVSKKVEDAVSKERQAINEMAAEATPMELSGKVEQHLQSTTKQIVDTLQAESTAAALDVDTNYLAGLHTLDANGLTIRVAQLAMEMKHRSKWEAVRLVEALRQMQEATQKKSKEVLERQQQLHSELLQRELRLQEEILTRKTREKMERLEKQYTEDLTRNVEQQTTVIKNKLEQQFAADKEAIEDRFAAQLKAKSLELQETLATERKQRVGELENYRTQLHALNTVLERTSTYEAFSHQVHKASMAALALSDRIEAAGPLSREIKALREFARNDVFIDAALQTLPSHVIEEGAPSVSQLQERFQTVKAVGRRAAMVPENSGLLGQMFGGALSYLIIPPGGPIEGDDADAVLSRADYALKAGDIEKALEEMKTLKGLPAEVSQDWIAAAESRLAVEQTAKVVKAHISLLAASCS